MGWHIPTNGANLRTVCKYKIAIGSWHFKTCLLCCCSNFVESNYVKSEVSVMRLFSDIDSRPFSSGKCFTMGLYTYLTKEVPQQRGLSWRRHQMETFSLLLAICEGNSPVSGEFPTQRSGTRSFDVFFDVGLNIRLRKQSWGWWFETPTRSLWLHCNMCLSCCIRCTTHCDQGFFCGVYYACR